MAAPQLIGQAPASASANYPAAPGRRRLPDDLLRDASRRLGIIALLAGILWVAGLLLDHLLIQRASGDPAWLAFQSADAIGLASAVVSFALFFYTRRSSRSPAFILDLGLGFLVFLSAALGLIWHWAPSTAEPVPGVSWIGVAVLLFAAVVPSTPLKTLVTGLLAVSMNPLGMAIARARGGWQYESFGDLLRMHYWDYLVVGVAVVISQVVTKLGQQVSRAREMGSYQLGDLLGKGGMGEVYRATHRMLARPAAIKLIRPETIGNGAAGELAVKRFRREAQAAANLRSPHTVELYDFGVTTDETLYFVMELLDGMTLDVLVREHGPLPANRVIHILRQVCASLQEAHAAGLVHRDIKPANIHIGHLGLSHDFVKVLDFGLVKSVETVPRELSLATEVGLTPGTPDYMAPEMILGESIDSRADLYALGCVAYYLLTGKTCFESANVVHVIARHLNEVPVPPSQRADNSVPAALEQLVLDCLAKRPEQRPRSAAELSRALTAIDVAPWDEEQAAEWWRTRASVAE
ncbi:MAG TPA: serine/threonine-protein kinase [Gemmatimonadales bacterium]|jgi:serine/threonine-protein kinase|nr:serine/threonine-protein kinase [Gemmatimonadales bacterium]